jgi:hypothetical protein
MNRSRLAPLATSFILACSHLAPDGAPPLAAELPGADAGSVADASSSVADASSVAADAADAGDASSSADAADAGDASSFADAANTGDASSFADAADARAEIDSGPPDAALPPCQLTAAAEGAAECGNEAVAECGANGSLYYCPVAPGGTSTSSPPIPSSYWHCGELTDTSSATCWCCAVIDAGPAQTPEPCELESEPGSPCYLDLCAGNEAWYCAPNNYGTTSPVPSTIPDEACGPLTPQQNAPYCWCCALPDAGD